MSRSTLSLMVVVGILAILSSWLSREQDGDTQAATAPLPHIPDYYIAGFSAATYSPQGTQRNRLSAERMTHYADDRTTKLVKPQLTFFADNADVWQLAAGTGDVDASGDTLELDDSVQISKGSESEGQFALSTQKLTVYTTKQFATTRTPVTITAPGTNIEAAGGLDAHFDDGQLVLFSVRGRYEP